MTDDSSALSDEAAREELYTLLNRNRPPKQVIDEVLEIGSRYIGTEHGHITNIDESENRWDVIGSTDPPDGPYPSGLSAKLSDSYCRRTIQQSSPLMLHDAGNQGWADDHAYKLHRLNTYLGVRIDVFGEPYGTVCFASREPRESFSVAERIFMELAGQVLRQTLERSYYEKNLASRDRLISVLNRVLRHNLRNDLNVIQGYAQLLQSRTSDEEARWAGIIESTTGELLALAKKGRKLEQLTRTVQIPRPTDIVPVVEEVVTEIDHRHDAADLSLTTPEEAIAFASPEFAEATKELVDNAARHGGSRPSIQVEILRTSDETTVVVEDDGPGLPAGEQRVLTVGDETPLEHGSGLGLALVYWIITNLDGEIEVSATPSGTTVELQLQTASLHSAEAHNLGEQRLRSKIRNPD